MDVIRWSSEGLVVVASANIKRGLGRGLGPRVVTCPVASADTASKKGMPTALNVLNIELIRDYAV